MKLNRLLILPTLFILVSCNGTKLNIEDTTNEEMTVLTSSSFVSLITNKTDFICFVSLRGCLDCSSVRTILNKYVSDNKKLIYEIDQGDYNSIPTSDFSYPLDHYPVLLFIKEAKVVDQKQNNLTTESEVIRLLNNKIN